MPFAGLKLHPNLLRGIKELGFARPTPIQADAIPPALAGRDVLACAMTGSGKTAAFVLPILQSLMDRPRGTTRALILTPTRELALQILEDIDDLAVHTPVNAAAIIGGVGMGPQEHALRQGVDVLVATPGRLLDHFRSPYAKLPGLEILVLDEADRMLDMGFLPEIRRVLRHIPAKRQTLFFSATIPPPIANLSREMLRSPVTLNIERKSAPAVGITQAAYPVPQHLKSGLLVALIRNGDIRQALVFTRTRKRANRLADALVGAGLSADRIHGSRSQAQRTQALKHFKSGRSSVLVATDIAARGIDVEALGHVVNFDVPMTPDDYIHRIGRTGRAELTGDAFTFVSPGEEADLRAIERVLGRRLPRVTVPDFDYSAAAEMSASRSDGSRGSRDAATRRNGGGRAGPGRAGTSGPGRSRRGAPGRRGAGTRSPATPAPASPRAPTVAPRSGSRSGAPGRRHASRGRPGQRHMRRGTTRV